MPTKSLVVYVAGLLAMLVGMGKAADRPNILLAISDDQSWVHAGAYGCPGLETPAFDRIAQQGVLFNNAFSAAPMCTVSRACLLTGRNQWQNREAGNHWSVFPRDLPAYPYLLEEAGYAIGYTGKGWSPGEWKPTGWPTNPAGPTLNDKKCKPPTTGIKNVDYAANFRDFLDQKDASKPFCFWYGASEPHGPWEKGSGVRLGKKLDEIVLPSFLDDTPENRGRLADIFVEIEWFDKHLGGMLDLLEERGQLDNTLIVVTGDNGTSVAHAKGNLYEYGVHVPMAAMWPQEIATGRTVDDLVSFIDLAPTFLEAAGLVPHASMTGRSLMSILTSKKNGRIDSACRYIFLGQERGSHVRYDNLGYPMRGIRSQQYLYIMNLKPDRWPIGDPAYVLREKRKASNTEILIEDLPPEARKRPAEQLFDISRDPGCLENLAQNAAFKKVRDDLRDRLTETLTRQGDPRFCGYGDIWESYPRFGVMRPYLGGFAERGKYNPKYQMERTR